MAWYQGYQAIIKTNADKVHTSYQVKTHIYTNYLKEQPLSRLIALSQVVWFTYYVNISFTEGV